MYKYNIRIYLGKLLRLYWQKVPGNIKCSKVFPSDLDDLLQKRCAVYIYYLFIIDIDVFFFYNLELFFTAMILQYFISYYFVYDTIQFISCGKTTLWLVKMLWLAGSSKRPNTVIKDNLKSAEITIMFNKKESSSSNI